MRRTRNERDHLKRKAWRLRVEERLTQSEIAERIGCDHSTVSRWLAETEDELAARFTDEALRVRAQITGRLQDIGRRAMGAFERSQEDDVTETETHGPQGTEHRTVTRGQSGNPALLEAARKADMDIAALWGLEAPKKTDVTSGGKEIRGLSFEAALTELRKPTNEPEPDGDLEDCGGAEGL